jgi:hypothetical protein
VGDSIARQANSAIFRWAMSEGGRSREPRDAGLVAERVEQIDECASGGFHRCLTSCSHRGTIGVATAVQIGDEEIV